MGSGAEQDQLPRVRQPPTDEPINVLVIDDDPYDRVLVADYLADVKNATYNVQSVASCEAAFAVLAQRRPDVCLVDYQLGERNGIELIQQARAAGAKMPMIMLTGAGNRDVDVTAMYAGANDYLDKRQLDSALLERTIRYALERGRLQQLLEQRGDELERINASLQREIAERERVQQQLHHLATHDPLTGLPNRLLLRDRLERAIARAQRYRQLAALLLLDLDGFKEINDTLGHGAGDRLLQGASARLLSLVRDCDTVARMGGDEFVLLLSDLHQVSDAELVGERVVSVFREPFQIEHRTLEISASIGISIFPEHADQPDALLRFADMAMYQAKRRGGSASQTFMAVSDLDQGHLLVEELGRALKGRELELWYQPIYGFRRNTPMAMEALVRWRHPRLGLLPPKRFIPAAEQTGLIAELGAWVLREACKQAREWLDETGREIPVAVNISPKQLELPSFTSLVARVLSEARLSPRLLELELPESAALHDVRGGRNALAALHELGCKVVIDNMGEGYSSLLRLRELPIDGIKIERSFLQNAVHDRRDAAILMALIALGRVSGLEVTVEGVETEEQLDLLRRAGADVLRSLECDRLQGFFLAEPGPVTAVRLGDG